MSKYQERTTQLRESFDVNNTQRQEIYRLTLLLKEKATDNNELQYACDFIEHHSLTQARGKNKFIRDLINLIILLLVIRFA